MESNVHLPFVSVVMPVRDEAAFIERSLGAVLAQDYPADRMEILVADGMSNDGTRSLVESFRQRHTNVTLLENPRQITAAGINVAISSARGEIIVLVGGHCEAAPDYLRRCVAHLSNGEIGVVGGALDTVGETPTADVIAKAMSSRFGVGNVAFRTVNNRTMLVDTVAFGAYKRAVLEEAGPFDEEFIRNQDDEFNYRLLAKGEKVLLASDVHIRYYSRATLRGLWNQYFRYGYWKVRVMQKHPRQMRVRHFVPSMFVAALLGSFLMALFWPIGQLSLILVVASYGIASCVAAVAAAGYRLFRVPLLCLTFGVMHLAYGSGFLCGLYAALRAPSEDRHSKHLPQAEAEKVRELRNAYRDYSQSESTQSRWSGRNPGNQAILFERTRCLKHALREGGFFPLDQRRVLDVGCGSGQVLAGFAEWGGSADRLHGVDLLVERIEKAREFFPALQFEQGNAERLGFEDESLDLVVLFTVFSSILDAGMASNVAREVSRVLKPGGAAVWYDLRFDNPRNRRVRGMSRKAIRQLFPDFELSLRTVTLLPPLARRLGRSTFTLYPILAHVPFLRSHYLGLLTKPSV